MPEVSRVVVLESYRNGVPVSLSLQLMYVESKYNPKAISSRGAIGLYQLMPSTAHNLGVDPHDPLQNVKGGIAYLRQQYDRFESWEYALAAYNAGPGAVTKYGGVPPYPETQRFIQKIKEGIDWTNLVKE